MDILIEDLGDSLWAIALENRQLAGIELDPGTEQVRWGDIYLAGVRRIHKGLNAAFVDLGDGLTGILFANDHPKNHGKKDKKKIGELLQTGQMIMVQAKHTRLPDTDNENLKLEDKSPRVSMDIALPGRFLIYTPHEEENRISRRIKDKTQRKQLQNMRDAIHDIHGCIIRSAALNCQTDVLIREGKTLKKQWEAIKKSAAGGKPRKIFDGPDAIARCLSDNAAVLIDTIEIASFECFEMAENWCAVFAPDLVTKIRPMKADEEAGDPGLLETQDIVTQIEDLLQPYVILTGGISMIIEETAALTVIDINSSGKNSILATNLAAADEVARQIRLRNLGGILIVDFINMRSNADQNRIIRRIEDAFSDDPCTVNVHGFTQLGLLELSRKRRTAKLSQRFENLH